VSTIQQSFSQGNIETSTNPMDLAINGGGFFRMNSGGSISYSRNGQFTIDKSGYIVNTSGARLTGYPATAAGGITTSTPGDLHCRRPTFPKSTSTSQVVCNLDGTSATLSAAGFNMANTATYNSSTSLSTYDSLGNAHRFPCTW